jgi:hypothetical protein
MLEVLNRPRFAAMRDCDAQPPEGPKATFGASGGSGKVFPTARIPGSSLLGPLVREALLV